MFLKTVTVFVILLIEPFLYHVSSFTATSITSTAITKHKCYPKLSQPTVLRIPIKTNNCFNNEYRQVRASSAMLRATPSLTSIEGEHGNFHDVTIEGEDLFSSKDVLVVAGFTLSLAATFAIMFLAGPVGSWRYYLAGGVCACASHAIATPIDVVKTRKQVDIAFRDKRSVKVFFKIIRKEGIGALFVGLGPTAFGYLFEGAFKFGVYEVAKPVMQKLLSCIASFFSSEFLASRMMTYVVSGIVSGWVASIILCPMEALRIRLVAEPSFAKKGWILGGMKMIHDEGISGFFRGLTAMMTKQIPYTVTKQVSFDILTSFMYAKVIHFGLALNSHNKILVPLVAALIASMLSCISSHPGDMLLSVVNAQEGKRRTREIAQDIIREEGIRGLLRGIAPRFLHTGIIVTSQLLIYDGIKRLCGCGITGLG